MKLQYTKEQLFSMATEPLRYQEIASQLQEFYTFIKSGFYTNRAIKDICSEYNLDLRRKDDRLALARIACKLELNIEENEELEDTKTELESAKNELRKATQATRIVAIALLTPGAPLNGRENTPAFKIFNSPTTKDMLKNNYQVIRKEIHPDTTLEQLCPETINAKFAFVNQLYDLLSQNWEDKYDPTLAIAPEVLQKAMRSKLPFSPDLFSKYFKK